MASSGLSLTDINAVSWVFGAVALGLTTGRYVIRWKVMGGFRADDYAHLAAVILLVASLGLYTGMIPMLQAFLNVEEGLSEEMPDVNAIQTATIASTILFFGCLWSVKIAYLLFYRSLFNVTKSFSIAWWSVLAFNIITFWVCVAGTLVQCGGSASNLYNQAICNSQASMTLDVQIYIFSYVSIVASDLATMFLPLWMLSQLNLRRGQKIAIGCVFCLSFLSIAFESLRVGESIGGFGQLTALWMNLEADVAVIVSALPCYYTLFITSSRRTSSGYTYDSDGRRIEPGQSPQRSKQLSSSKSSSGDWSDAHPTSDYWGRSHSYSVQVAAENV